MKPEPSSRATRFLTPVLLLLVVALPAPARAVASHDPLRVTITQVSPTTLTKGATLTVAGTVTNVDSSRWRSLQAYLTVPRAPFTTRDAMHTAVSSNTGYTGERIVDVPAIDDLGDLAPAESVTFQVQVPWKTLGFTGASGVYPVGIQILATAPDGSRANKAVGRATTFIPLVPAKVAAVPTTLVWPFLLPSQRAPDGDYRSSVVESLQEGGQLRNLLEFAEATPRNGSTLLLDPALLVAADDISTGRHTTATRDKQRGAAAFLTAIRAFADSGSTWLLGYGNPDEFALSSVRNGDRLRSAVDAATTAAATTFDLKATRASWFTSGGVDAAAIGDLNRRPALVSADDATAWHDALGSVVTDATSRGPLVILDDLTGDAPGNASAAVLRQSLLSDAALAALDRVAHKNSAADAVLIVPPGWDPGPDAVAISDAFSAPFVVARNLDSRLRDRPRDLPSAFADPTVTSVGKSVITAANDFLTASAHALEVADGNPTLAATLAGEASLLTAVTWRGRSSAAVDAAQGRGNELTTELDRLVIEGPPSFILSGSEGRFPLTISNATNFPVRVGVKLDSGNPSLSIPDIEPVVINAHARRQLTVTIDVGRQKSSTVVATMVSQSGRHVGTPFEFNLRSSNVDSVVWIAMGGAVLFVILTIGRRLGSRDRS